MPKKTEAWRRTSHAQRQSRYTRGHRAETLACCLLRVKGYTVLARRLRTPLGEVDILAKRGQTVALVEVKQRPQLADAAAALSRHQQRRLLNAARFVLAQRPELSHHTFRFDVVLVNRWGWLRHLPNAWDAGPSGG